MQNTSRIWKGLVILLVATLAMSASYYVGAYSGTNPVITIGTQTKTADAIIWKQGSTYYATNGVTGAVDYSGSNFSLVLESTLINNTDVFLMQGQYTQSQEFVLDNLHNATLKGAGMGLTEIIGSSQGSLVKVGNTPSTNCLFQDFTVNGNDENVTGISLGNATEYFTFSRVEVKNTGSFNMWGSIAFNLVVDSCRFSSSGQIVPADLVAIACWDTKFTNNYFEKIDGLGGGCLTSGQWIRVECIGNHFRNNATVSYASISLENFYNYFQDVTISNNIAIGWNASATMNIGNSQNYRNDRPTVTSNVLWGGGIALYRATQAHIESNSIRQSIYGIVVSNASDSTISNNMICETAVNGVGSTGDKGGLYLAQVYNCTISGNTISDYQSPHTTPYGIIFDGNYSIIQGNRIGQTLGYGIGLTANAFNNTVCDNLIVSNDGWGIQFATGADWNFAHGNQLTDNGSGDMTGHDADDNRARDNYGDSGLIES